MFGLDGFLLLRAPFITSSTFLTHVRGQAHAVCSKNAGGYYFHSCEIICFQETQSFYVLGA